MDFNSLFYLSSILYASHCIGDYVFQSEFILKYKSKDDFVLGIHCTLYTTAVILGCAIAEFMEYIKIDNYSYLILLIYISHYIIDKTIILYKDKLKEQFGTEQLNEKDSIAHNMNIKGYYSDQTLHIIFLMIGCCL